MKALTVHPVYAMCIVGGQKTVECRTWKTSYRGPILICSSAKKFHGSIPGHALGVVDLVDVVPFKREHIKPSMEDGMIYDAYAWILENPRIIEPIPVKGKLSLWNFEHDEKIVYLPKPKNEEEDEALGAKYWDPLII